MKKTKKQIQSVPYDKIFRRLFIITLPQMTGFLCKFEKKKKNASIRINTDQKLLKIFESIWNRISDITRKKLDKQFMYKIKMKVMINIFYTLSVNTKRSQKKEEVHQRKNSNS